MSKGRRTARVSVAVAAAGVVALAGCAPEDVDGPDSAEEGEEQEETFLQLATGSTGGTYYPLGGEIAQLWSDNIDNVQVDSFATGASVQNMRALEGETEDEEEGEAEQSELVMAVNGTAMEAVDGEGAFADEPMDNPEGLMTLGNIYPEVTQIVVLEDSDIETIDDLEGANIEIGPPGSATEEAAPAILEAYGVDWDSVNTFDSTFGDAATALGDGQVDAAIGLLSVPAAGVMEIGANNDVRVLPIDGEEGEDLIGQDPSYTPFNIEGGTYPGQDEDVETLTQWATLYSMDTLDDDLAYELTSTMYEQAGDLGHDVADQVVLETALEGLGDMELHPGAERYYEEQGVLD